jgi:hypothetical protein
MKKNYKGEILFVVISTTIVSTIWVASDIYNKSVTSTLDETLQFQIQPIQGSFDMQTIQKIRTRTRIAPEFNGEPQPQPQPQSQPQQPTASASGDSTREASEIDIENQQPGGIP